VSNPLIPVLITQLANVSLIGDEDLLSNLVNLATRNVGANQTQRLTGSQLATLIRNTFENADFSIPLRNKSGASQIIDYPQDFGHFIRASHFDPFGIEVSADWDDFADNRRGITYIYNSGNTSATVSFAGAFYTPPTGVSLELAPGELALLVRAGSGLFAYIPIKQGGATPAGTGTELQYKNGTELGAVAGSDWDGTNLNLPTNLRNATAFSLRAGDPAASYSEVSALTSAIGLLWYAATGDKTRELTVGEDGPRFTSFDGMSGGVYDMAHEGNVKTVGGQSIFGAGDIPAGGAEIVMEWTTAGTYANIARPDPAVYPNCEMTLIASGGGGGSGRRGLSSEICRGGGGGGAGGVVAAIVRTVDITSPFTVVVGAGGAGGAAITTDNTNGVSGVGGSASTITIQAGTGASTNTISASGGNPGGGGTTTLGSGGNSASVNLLYGVSVINSGGGGSNASGNGTNGGGNSNLIPSSGGGGGSLTASTTTNFTGGLTSQGSSVFNGFVAGGSASAPNGGSGFIPSILRVSTVSLGGSGGAAIHAGVGGNGGNGIRGSGGGGGGGSRNGNTSGAGGNGGDGYVRLRFYA
jgi:hypothetical protein